MDRNQNTTYRPNAGGFAPVWESKSVCYLRFLGHVLAKRERWHIPILNLAGEMPAEAESAFGSKQAGSVKGLGTDIMSLYLFESQPSAQEHSQ